jgi:hypothetical protein
MRKILFLGALLGVAVSCQQGNPTEPPLPPGNSALTGRIEAENSAVLRWTQCPDGNFLRYRLYRSGTSGVQQNPDRATLILETGNRSLLEHTDPGLPAGHWYYALETENDYHLTSWSNEVHLEVFGY